MNCEIEFHCQGNKACEANKGFFVIINNKIVAGVSQRQLCERLESKTVPTPVIRDLQEGVVF